MHILYTAATAIAQHPVELDAQYLQSKPYPFFPVPSQAPKIWRGL